MILYSLLILVHLRRNIQMNMIYNIKFQFKNNNSDVAEMIFCSFLRPRFLRVFLLGRLRLEIKVHRLMLMKLRSFELNLRNRFAGDFDFRRWIGQCGQKRRRVQAESFFAVVLANRLTGRGWKASIQIGRGDDRMMQDLLVFDMRS